MSKCFVPSHPLWNLGDLAPPITRQPPLNARRFSQVCTTTRAWIYEAVHTFIYKARKVCKIPKTLPHRALISQHKSFIVKNIQTLSSNDCVVCAGYARWRVVCVQVFTTKDRTWSHFWFVFEKDKTNDILPWGQCLTMSLVRVRFVTRPQMKYVVMLLEVLGR